MKTRVSLKNRQGGAVAVMVGISIVLLVGFLALVIDLGRLYLAKTGLQNAADAAALSGARELDGSLTGISNAVAKAVEAGELNSFFGSLGQQQVELGSGSDLSNGNIWFSNSPSGPNWYHGNDNEVQNNPGNKFFIKVDTASGNLTTWFASVFDLLTGGSHSNTSTFGMAVAGRTTCQGLPMFACARDPSSPPLYGFVPGQSYKLTAKTGANITIGPGNIGWMDPVAPGSPGLISGANDMRDVLCRGVTQCLSAPATFSSLTQNAFNPTADALNTRFDLYPGTLNGMEASCPPDHNIKEYKYSDSTGTGSPNDWMAAAPLDRQSEDDPGLTPGVHWAAVLPASGTPAVSAGYPSSGTPYTQAKPSLFYKEPTDNLALSMPGRRILTMGIVTNCGGINGAGEPVIVPKFGKFFMQEQALDTGSDKGFYGEFIGVTDTPPPVFKDIRLYQ